MTLSKFQHKYKKSKDVDKDLYTTSNQLNMEKKPPHFVASELAHNFWQCIIAKL
jgi:hypothetical protein